METLDTTLRDILRAAQAHAPGGTAPPLARLVLPLLTALHDHDDQDDVADLLADLVGKEHRKTLRRALRDGHATVINALEDDPPLQDACAALVAALSDDAGGRSDSASDSNTRMTQQQMSGGRDVINSPQITADTFVEADHTEAERQQRALVNHLRALRTTCNVLQLSQIDEQEAGENSMQLEQVYIGLHTASQVPVAGDREGKRKRNEQETRPLPALEALAQQHPARLMLLGAPGSGKSTFVNHLALCMAGAVLCRLRSDEPHPCTGWLERLTDWPYGALLPVRVILRDLAAYDPVMKAPCGSVDVLWSFLKRLLGPHAAACDAIETEMTGGRALLLFDGLDEVVGEPVLTRVVETITDAAATYTRCPVLVTCRELDYQANSRRHMRGFRVEKLALLSDEQMQQFVAAWYAELEASGREMLGTPARLQQALQSNADLRDLGRQPLLLTMMAIVHAGKGALPSARALLYAECIDLLLKRWRKGRDEPDVLAKLNLPQFNENHLLAAMARLGFAAHEQAERQRGEGEEDASRPADLNRAQVQRELGAVFASYTMGDDMRCENLVSTLLHEIAARNGLVQKRSSEDGEVYSFPHRSFQEFLAGYHISSQYNADQLALERAPHIHWHEVLRLMGSYQVRSTPPTYGPPLNLARDLLERGVLEQVLAGELLDIVGFLSAQSYRRDLTDTLWKQARQRLTAIATRGRAPKADAALRVRAGWALGRLCYGNVEALAQTGGSRLPLPDPRLPLALVGTPLEGTKHWWKALDVYWCHLPPGPFWFGDEKARKGKLQQRDLPHDCWIGRYPVTNAEYARFIAAGGYDPDQPWWTEQGRRFLAPGGHRWDNQEEWIILPRLWHNPSYTNPLQPVVCVSWYEAAAYCCWLTAQGHAQGWLPHTQVIRLPTSREWERAARHTDQRRYPWGNEPSPPPEHANYDKTGIGAPAPVGCFPAGQAVCGALDMLGNVWEWTATHFEQDDAPQPQPDFKPDDGVRLRGGSFYSKLEQMFCGSCYGDLADYGDYDFIGLRLLRFLCSSEHVF